MNAPQEMFDDLGGRFEARLRDHRMVTRTASMREGEITLANPVAILEVKFDFEVLDRLHEPSFVGVERQTSKGPTYMIYEIIALRPTHFQMLGMDIAMPTVIRKEYLDTIDSSWGKSDETWIDVVAIPTNYRMDQDKGELKFSRARLVPLTGSKVHLLSNDTVKKFLCVEGGVPVGSLMGFNMPLTVKLESMIKYHAGLFGFTGSGKSNLASYLIREAIHSMPDLKVVVVDVAGEYPIHLLDLVGRYGLVFSTEDFDNSPVNFLNSQAVPETLEEEVAEDILLEKVKELFDQKRVQRISLSAPEEAPAITIGYIMSILQKAAEGGSGAIQATIALQSIVRHFIKEKGYETKVDVSSLSEEDREQLVGTLDNIIQTVHGMSSIKVDLTALVDYIKGISDTREEEATEEEGSTIMNPESLASFVLAKESPQLNIIYIPEPDDARFAVSRFINRLLLLKKTSGARSKILVVLDEAQEFIPDRAVRGDFSDSSNKSVEALLRQGRKYRAHCWLCTQRVAHLNVNALQQLHSYFVSTLPRFYDRMVIADAFSLSYDMLERTIELETGQWLFVSYKATKQKNVPAFIQTPNNEEILLDKLGISIKYGNIS